MDESDIHYIELSSILPQTIRKGKYYIVSTMDVTARNEHALVK